MMNDTTAKTPLSTQLLWSSGSIASGAIFNAMALFALYFMTSVLGISAGLAGTLLLVTKLYDAVTDPIMGSISDRTIHRWGPRRPYVLYGAIAMGLSFALFFNLPSLDGAMLLIATVVALLLYSTCYTVFAVPYLAMPPSVAPTYDARAQLMSFRVAFLIVGVLIGSVGGPKIVEFGGDGADGFALLGICIGALATVAGLVAFFGTTNVTETIETQEGPSGGLLRGAHAAMGNVVAVFANAPFRLLTIVKLLQLAVLAVALACTPYFFSLVLERSTGDIGKYLSVFSLTGLVSLIFWRFAIARFGKRNIYIFSIAGYGVGMLSWLLWQPGEAEVFFYLRAAIIGCLSNGTLLCALSLLPDTMEYDQLASGENRGGVMSGVFTTVEKLAGAVGPFIVGIALQASGLIPGAAPEAQPDSAVNAVHLSFALVPAILCFAAIPVLWRYRLGASELVAMREASR
ncbi:MAG: MFS transporter [Pseudomonadota bacterium]